MWAWKRDYTMICLCVTQATIEQFKEQLEDSRETAADIQRQLTKAVGEASALRQKADMAEEGIKPEEMEDLKRKMGVRLQDSESQLEAALTKAVSMEKAKNRLQVELEAVAEDLEKVKRRKISTFNGF